METVTLKLDRRHIEMLKEHAEASGRSQAAVVRDLIEQHLGRLCGSVSLS
jgi:predicted DNA-binding protein